HDQPWPRGRFNHYIFDLNRDWFAMTQPETIGKVQAVLEWNPVVYVDSHEMGGDNTYYFPPAAKPYNPNITEAQRDNQVQLGQNMASYFDAFGVPYFTREVYDAFYPGYGDMWPTLNGATAMTFEQASPRGLVFSRRDGSELTYAEGVRNNVLSSLATLEVVARNKEDYLSGYARYRRSAIDEGQSANDRYVVMDLATRRFEAESLARTLARQGLEVFRAENGANLCGRRYPEGAFIVDLAQPQGRLARTLLSQQTSLADEFIAEQESRRDRGLNHELYDVTAWSLPLMFGLEADQCNRAAISGATVVSADDPIMSIGNVGAEFGYIIPWTDSGQARLVIAALQEGLKGKTTDEPFNYNGKTYPSGSAIFTIAANSSYLGRDLSDLANEIGAEFVAMDSSWVEDGPNFGSSSFATLKLPKVALAWGEGTSPTSAGSVRYVLERKLGLPVATIRVSSMGRADLSEYDVVILPDSYGNMLDTFGRTSSLEDFVERGGVLIAIDGALAELSSSDLGLISTKREYAVSEGDHKDEDDAEASRVEGTILETIDDYEAYIHDHRASPEDIPGVLVNVEANTDHWLSAGYDSAIALVTGRDIYQPLNEADGVNVFRFADADELLVSGYLWEENRVQLAFKPFVIAEEIGQGVTIGFTQSPATRAYLDGLNLLIANAVVIAPSRVAH
ncbi:MAG: M14 family metallopeptidase, partial [Aquisalinus sp.]|nr:M14 family metallopeptidase [Aquisalinus sp.]